LVTGQIGRGNPFGGDRAWALRNLPSKP